MKSSSRRGTAGWETTLGVISSLLLNQRDFFRAGAGGIVPGLVNIFGGTLGCMQRLHVQCLREHPGEGLPFGGTRLAFKTISIKGMNDLMSCSQAKGTGNEKQKAEL